MTETAAPFVDCEFETYEIGDVVTITGYHPGGREAAPHRWEITWVSDKGCNRYGVRRIKDGLQARWSPWGDICKITARSARRLCCSARTIPNTLTPRQRAAEAKRIAAFNWQPKGHPLRKAQ